jgi:phosphatidylethanolamine/phosphatidyl-N-methylethanolamine N-methyltransferase
MTAAQDWLVFWRSMMDNPVRIGAVLPSSPQLGARMARHIHLAPDEVLVEIGAGTGVVTRALLAAGVPAHRLYIVELDSRLAGHLRRHFPKSHVIEGNAGDLPSLLPPELVGHVGTVVSSLPLRPMSRDVQQQIVDAAFAVLKPGGGLLQYTYPPFSPLPAREMGLKAEGLGRTWRNLPPAAVWRFTKA